MTRSPILAAFRIATVVLAGLIGGLAAWALRPDRPAPEPAVLSVTLFMVCGVSTGVLVVDTDGSAGWVAEPMEPGLRAGLLSKVGPGTLLVKITPRECAEFST
jgi:hypothetical protein